MSDLAYGTPIKAANADDVHDHEEHVHRLPEPLGRSVAHEPHEDLRREPAAEGLQLGHGGARALDERDGKPLKGILYKPENFDPNKKYPMISYFYEILSNGLYSYVRADRPQRHQPDALRVERLSRLRAGHRLRGRASGHERGASRSCPACRRCVQRGLRRREAARPPGPVVGRLPDGVHDHADAHVRRGDGGRAGREHDERVRRHSLGHRASRARASTSRARAASASRSSKRRSSTSRTRRSSSCATSRRRCSS